MVYSRAKTYGLALHTTSPQLGLSISNFTGEERSQIFNFERELSNHLHQYLIQFLWPQTWADLNFIAVAKGPGGFTGTRLGVVTARTIAQQLEIPLFAISTLQAFVWWWLKDNPLNELIAVQMPARRGELFVAIYQPSLPTQTLKIYLGDSVMTSDTWSMTVDKLNQPYQLLSIPTLLGHTVTSLLELAYIEWQQGLRPNWVEALPFYGQHPV